MKRICQALLFLALAGGEVTAQTTIGLWSMGEDDAGAASSNSVNGTLTAAFGPNLSLTGTGLTYSASTAGGVSSLAVAFGGSGNYATGSNLGVFGSNFAIEAWVYLGSDVTTVQWVALMGDNTAGFGLLVSAGNIGMKKINSSVFETTTATPGVYAHVALVASLGEGTSGAFYYNGNPVGNTFSLSAPAANFSIGGDGSGGSRLLGGSMVDHVRVFTYSGTFNSSMFTYPASAITAIPEPSTFGVILGVGALGLVLWRRRVAVVSPRG